MDGLALKTPAAERVVTVDELQLQARIDHDEEDTLLEALIDAATRYVERVQGRQLLTATWTLALEDFPESGGRIEPPRSPLQSVVEIRYYDGDGVDQVFDAAKYRVHTDREPGRIELVSGESWPGVEDDRLDAVRIDFTAGWSSVSEVPRTLRLAVLMLAAHLYERREAVEQVRRGQLVEVPRGLDALLAVEWTGEHV